MRTTPIYLLCIAAGVFEAANSISRPQILADTNRDGIIDASDAADKEIWTDERGAIFLPNIGDKGNRCAAFDRNGLSLSNQELAGCNDASGHHLLAPELAAPVRTSPMSGLPQETIGKIQTRPESTVGLVRLLWKQPGFRGDDGSSWRLIDNQFVFNATALEAGLELALDARELVSDTTVWNGTASIVFQVTNGDTVAFDSVAMKQAPVLFHHHLQKVEEVTSVKANDTDFPVQAQFVRDLQDALEDVPGHLPLFLLNGTDEIWAQDFMEPGYASMPGPDGPISLRVLVRSAQSTRTAGRQIYEILRGDGVGGHQLPLGSGFGHEEINSGGNIETIPPYVSRKGTSFMNGRVIMAKHFDKHPARSMTDFIEAQGQQNPLILEAGWLVIGHVDEFVQFVPFDNELGFTIAVADTHGPLELLKKAQWSGHGSALVTSYPNLKPPTAFSFYNPRLQDMTINMLLADHDFIATNQYAQSHINSNLDMLLEEVPIARNDVLRIPSMFTNVTFPWPLGIDGLPPRLNRAPPGESQVIPLLPSVINGVVIGSDYLAPKAYGPVIDGQDIFEDLVKETYAKAGMKVHFIDDFMSHHINGGEVHCGTNTLRDTNIEWWKQ